MTDPTCPHAAHNARIAELEAEVEAARAEQARLNTAWRVKWEGAIDTYSSLLHKEQDVTERLKEDLAHARTVADAVVALVHSRGTIAAVRAASDAYEAYCTDKEPTP